jgi:hypothetical protein
VAGSSRFSSFGFQPLPLVASIVEANMEKKTGLLLFFCACSLSEEGVHSRITSGLLL